MLVQETERAEVPGRLRARLLSPTLAAPMASTFQWPVRWPRLLLNVVTGGEPQEQLAYGDSLRKADRYARCGEFLSVVRQLWAEPGPGHLQRRARVRGERDPPASPGPGPADLLRWVLGRGRAGRRRPRRHLPRPGASRCRPSRRRSTGSARWPRSGGRSLVLRHPAARHLAATPARKPGPRPTGCSAQSRSSPCGRSPGRRASPRASSDDRAVSTYHSGARCARPDARPGGRQPNLWSRRTAWSVVGARHRPGRSHEEVGAQRISEYMPTSASTTSSSRATRTSRRPGSSRRASYRTRVAAWSSSEAPD